MIYLASPYSDEDEDVRAERFFAACEAAGAIAAAGVPVFSPIAHSVPLVTFGAPDSGEYWQPIDDAILRTCRAVVVLCLPGWERSAGVAHEIALAYGLGLPTHYATAETVVFAAKAALAEAAHA